MPLVPNSFVRSLCQALLTTAMLCRNNDQPQRLTAAALSSLEDPPKTQLQDWVEKPQTHERLDVQGNPTQRATEMEAFLQDIEEKMAGNTS